MLFHANVCPSIFEKTRSSLEELARAQTYILTSTPLASRHTRTRGPLHPLNFCAVPGCTLNMWVASPSVPRNLLTDALFRPSLISKLIFYLGAPTSLRTIYCSQFSRRTGGRPRADYAEIVAVGAKAKLPHVLDTTIHTGCQCVATFPSPVVIIQQWGIDKWSH